jgi:hypothetical protein
MVRDPSGAWRSCVDRWAFLDAFIALTSSALIREGFALIGRLKRRLLQCNNGLKIILFHMFVVLESF